MRSKTLGIVLVALAFSILILASPGHDVSYPQALAAENQQADEPIKGLDFEVQGELFVGEALTFVPEVQEGTNVKYQWDLGDGSTSPLIDGGIVYTYAQPGNYNVKLIAQNDSGTTTVVRQLNIIRRPLPSLTIVVSGERVVDKLVRYTAVFDAEVSANVRFTWDFGNGSTQVGNSVTQKYSSSNIYNVSVVATNTADENHQSSASVQVVIANAPIVFASPPSVVGNASNLIITNPVKFEVHIASGSDISYRWDFGDGSSPSITREESIEHKYDAAGRYKVIVTASNSVNAVSNEFKDELIIEVNNEPPKIPRGFTAFCQQSPNAELRIDCAASLDEGSASSYVWEFEEQDVRHYRSGQFVSYIYETSGMYPIRAYYTSDLVPGGVGPDALLTVDVTPPSCNGVGGVGDTDDDNVEVPCLDDELQTNYGPPNPSINKEVSFTVSASSITPEKFVWDFGDGSELFEGEGNRTAYSHTYTDLGLVVVTVSAQTQDGTELASKSFSIFIWDEINLPMMLNWQ